MRVPRSFQLAGTTWRVLDAALIGEYGHCDTSEAVIRLNKGMSPQIRESTFCHELVHAIQDTMGLRDHDEKEVDAFGPLLHQFLTSKA